MVFDFERNRLRQQEIEVQALVALMRDGRTNTRKLMAEKKLCEIAFPEDHIEEIEQQTLHAKMHAKMDSMLDKLEYQ
mgnify:CR=1 FL=1